MNEYCLFIGEGTSDIIFQELEQIWSTYMKLEVLENYKELENYINKKLSAPLLVIINIHLFSKSLQGLKLIFEQGRSKNFLIIFLSNQLDEKVQAQLLALGPYDFIIWPSLDQKITNQLNEAVLKVLMFKKSGQNSLVNFLHHQDCIHALYVDFDQKSYSERSLFIEGFFNIKLSLAVSLLEMRKFVDLNPHYDFIIISERIPLAFLKIDSNIPMIILGDDDQINEYKILFINHLKKITFSSAEKLVDTIQTYMENHHKSKLHYDELTKGFCRVRPEHFFRFQRNPCDIYIKIGANKFIKILHQHDLLTAMDLENNKIEVGKEKFKFIYVKQNDFADFYHLLSTKIESLLNNGEFLDGDLTQKAILSGHELIQEIVTGLGLSQEAFSLGQMIVTKSLVFIKQYKDLEKMVYSQLYKDFYREKLCMITTYLACALASQKSWCTQQDLMVLGLSSIFCDISLDDVEDIKIQTNDELNAMEDLEKKNKVFNHSYESFKLIESFKELPSGIQEVICQHHEKKSGQGFPYGITGPLIRPLSQVFILAYDFSQYLLKNAENNEEELEIRELVEKYTADEDSHKKLRSVFNK